MGHALKENRNGLIVGAGKGFDTRDFVTDWQFTLAIAAYNLIRLPRLLGAVA